MSSHHELLRLDIADEQALYQHYMPFVEGGALFIATEHPYEIGDELFYLLKLYSAPEPLPLTGVVVWVTPSGASGARRSGVGIALGEAQRALADEIEQALTLVAHSHKATLTL
ncbi:pilus assembly protein PilZ [Gammaproteobacteria bacterium LSUCC0057]|uniref:Pilus assembly protein PilZ n=1 Tax=Gammaproteobacteria bacterium LSUCC0057 TaxID=2559237 RepID=A0A4Y8UMT8_9GAMM|nr:pilus assembly protein PilZ [Gammaproteobacteria bacterium LSUCC0057]